MDIKNWRAEVGYMLHSQYHGKGFISESLKAVLTYAFQELQFHSIQALIDPENVASENVLKNAVFPKKLILENMNTMMVDFGIQSFTLFLVVLMMINTSFRLNLNI